MQHPPKKTIRSRRKGWLILLVCLTLAAAIVWLIPALQKQAPAPQPIENTNEFTVKTLHGRLQEDVESIFLNGFVLHMHNGELMLAKGEELLSIDTGYAADLLQLAAQVVAQDTVAQTAQEVEGQLDDMGLHPARAQMRVRFRDGSETVLELGAAVPGTPYFYMRFSEADGIYMADPGMLETLGLTEKRLLPVVQPAVVPSLVDSLRLNNENGDSQFGFQSGSSAALMAPVPYPLNSDAAQTLLTALGSFRLGTKEAESTEQNRSAYGLDDPLCVMEIHQQGGAMAAVGEDGALTVNEIPEQSFRFVIGREEGDYFYTCEYENSIYLISRFLAETLVKADWRTLLSKTPAGMGDAPLDAIRLETAQDVTEYRITRTEKVLSNNELARDENGNPVIEVHATKNGQPCTEEQLNELLDRLNSLTIAGMLPAGYQIPEGEPRWRITLTAQNEVRVLEGWRLDAFSDAVSVNGTACHYLHADAMESLTAGLV